MKKSIFGLLIIGLLLLPTNGRANFVRGDIDNDGDVDSVDLSLLENVVGYSVASVGGGAPLALNVIPNHPPALELLGCPDKGDVNDDGKINRRDVTYLWSYLNSTGTAPQEPFPVAGADPTLDNFACGDCFVAGKTSTNGWVRRLRANNAHPTTHNHLTVTEIINSASLKDLQELAIVDHGTLVTLSKPSGFGQTNYLSVDGSLSASIHLGPLSAPPALGSQPLAIALDIDGNFLIGEDASLAQGITASQYVVINPMSSTALLTTPVNTVGNHLKAVRFDGRNPLDANDDVIIGMETISNNTTTHIVEVKADLSKRILCNENGSFFGGTDLTIDRQTGFYYYTMENFASGEVDQIRYCTSASTGSVVAFEDELPGAIFSNVVVAVDQMAALDEDIMVIANRSGQSHLYRITNTGTFDVFAAFDLTLPAGATDIICQPDK